MSTKRLAVWLLAVGVAAFLLVGVAVMVIIGGALRLGTDDTSPGSVVVAQVGSIIASWGTFASPDQQYRLQITRADTSLVHYTLSRVRNGKVLVDDQSMSDAMRWFLCWDVKGNLWVYSGDMGGCLWIRHEDGTFTGHQEDLKDYVKLIPKEFAERLPQSARGHYGLTN